MALWSYQLDIKQAFRNIFVALCLLSRSTYAGVMQPYEHLTWRKVLPINNELLSHHRFYQRAWIHHPSAKEKEKQYIQQSLETK